MFTTRKSKVKKAVLDYISRDCHGFRNAKKRADIIRELPITVRDRSFRRAASELKHEGNLASHSKYGIWFPPLHTNDAEEVQALRECWLEIKSKAMDMLTDKENGDPMYTLTGQDILRY